MRVLGISGSVRRDSHNTELLRAAAKLLPPGVELELYEGLKEIPAYDQDDEAQPPLAVVRLRERIASADAVLFATPEYNHSIPGALKNALDWVSRPKASTPLMGKPVAVIGASTGMFGAVWAQAELRKVLGAIGARVVDRELPVPAAHEVVGDPAKLEEMGINPLIGELLEELVEEARPAQSLAA
jgi:chromate reductase, NAD(P)H dehydrogenase (quinone)